MNFNKSKNIFKQWNKHINHLLTEVTDEELSFIEKALDKAVNNPSSLPFNTQFNGKLREVVPIAYDPYIEDDALGIMLNELALAGWKVDLNTGLASKEFTREFEGVVRTQNRQMKVNAIWTSFLDLLKKLETRYLAAYQKGFQLDKIADEINADPEIPKLDSQLKTLMGETITGKYFAGMAHKKAVERINDFIKTWQTEAPKIKGKLSESTYSVVFSRHPVDVLRMSDFKNITSCHSPISRPTGQYAGGGSYYNCAIAEARDGGAIAYLVKTEDIKNIDLQQRDIFSDEIRGTQLVDPIARIRMRVLLHAETQATIAVPEKRVYGTNIKGFEEAVSNWAITSQAQQFDIIAKKYTDKTIELEDFYRLGGMYQDNWVEDLFAKLKERIPSLKSYTLSGVVSFDNTTQNEVESENIGAVEELAKNEIELFNKKMESKKVQLVCDFKDTDFQVEGNEVIIYPSIYYYYNIPLDQIKQDEKIRQFLFSDRFEKYLNLYLEDFGIEQKYRKFQNVVEIEYLNAVQIRLVPDTIEFLGGVYPNNADDLADLLGNIYYEFFAKDNKIASINYLIQALLKQEQIIEGGELVVLNQYILNEEYKDDDIDWQLNADENDSINPSLVSGEIGVIIPYEKIINLQTLKANLLNKKFISQIKASVYEYPQFSGLDIVIDDDQDLMIYFQIELESGVEDKYVVAAKTMFNISKAALTEKMILLINKMFAVATQDPKTKLQEFKHISNRWKMFLD